MPRYLMRSVIVVSLIAIYGCEDGEDSSPSTAAPPTRQYYGDFSFETPSGWLKVRPDLLKTRAMLLVGSDTWQEASGMIKVDVGPPAHQTPQESASHFAEIINGHISTDTPDFDGEMAIKVTTSSTTLDLPQEINIIFRDGKAYFIMIGAVEGVDPGDVMEHVRSTWRWED